MNPLQEQERQFHRWFAANKVNLGWSDRIGDPSAEEYKQMFDLWTLSRLEEERCRTDKKEREKRRAQYSCIVREYKIARARAQAKVQEKTLMDFLYSSQKKIK